MKSAAFLLVRPLRSLFADHDQALTRVSCIHACYTLDERAARARQVKSALDIFGI